jgi:hypothetical protein
LILSILREPRAGGSSIAEEFLQGIAGFLFAADIFGWRREFPPHHVKILAVVGEVFFRNQISPAVPALLGHPGIEADTIPAHPKIGGARVAGLLPSGRSGERVFGAAFPAMSGQGHRKSLKSSGRKLQRRLNPDEKQVIINMEV